MGDAYKVQINAKIGDHLVNFQGDTPEEAFGYMVALHAHRQELVQMLAELDTLPIAEKEWGSRSQRRKPTKGGGGWSRTSGASSAGSSMSASAPSVPSNPNPPPSFVPDQNAQPAQGGQQPPPQQQGWSPAPQPVQNPVQVAQQALGGQVEMTVPNEVAYCVDHGNQPRQYYAPGTNQNTGQQYSASYRCSQKGCGAWWQNRDGSWRRSSNR